MYFLLSGTAVFLWISYIIYSYIFGEYGVPHWVENLTGISTYLITVWVIYAMYKSWQVFRQKIRVTFTFWHIIGFSLIHILIISLIFFTLKEVKDVSDPTVLAYGGLATFFFIIRLLLYPLILTLISRSLGYTLLDSFFREWKNEEFRLRLPTETAVWFWVLSLLFLVLGIFSLFSLVPVLVVLAITAGLSYRGFIESWHDIQERKMSFAWHDLSKNTFIDVFAPKLVIAEIAFLFITFIFSVSLISILRPMPIGWDDLGAYMNYPKIMALSGASLAGNGLYLWQLITGTWFLFDMSAPQAFFLNQLGGIFSIIAIALGLSLLLEEKGKKSLLPLPILFAWVFYSMPMIVFQQAKDMKLDPALMFFSVSAITLLMIVLRRMRDHTANIEEWKKGLSPFSLMIIAALVIGFAFSLKVTTLMLILGAIAVLCFRIFGYGWYLGFFFAFIAIFTKLDFWSLLNVSFPKENSTLVNGVFLSFMALSLLSFSYSIWKNGWKQSRVMVLVASLTLIIPLTPWFAKNISESRTLSINGMLGWSGWVFVPEYSKLYSSSEIEAIKLKRDASVGSSGQTTNEDFGRYFGYEDGINNFLKLPHNLTFQKNQSGEYTDITFFYFALLPILLLFVLSKNGRFGIFVGLVAAFMAMYYFYPPTAKLFTIFFAWFSLPGWYLIIFWLFILATIAPVMLLSRSPRDENFQDVTLFTAFYGVVFAISSFWIVWYGISIYYGFLLIIGFASLSFIHYTEEETRQDDGLIGKWSMSLILLAVIFMHFFLNAGPHAWNNLRASYFAEYKAGKMGLETSIFASHTDYLLPIAIMNLRDVNTAILAAKHEAKTREIQGVIASGTLDTLENMHGLIQYFIRQPVTTTNPAVIQDVKNMGQAFYKSILYPSNETKNTWKIYRIGTFMTYFISENRSRYLDDSLVMGFEDYIYDTNAEKAVERMKTLWLKYLLVDLNAATIDRDPRHDLTMRMEHLLATFTAKNLRLLSSDSTCLQYGLDQYKLGKIDMEKYVSLAWVNSESYGREGNTISRGVKLNNCYNDILTTLSTDPDWEKNYPYLKPIFTSIQSQNAGQNPTVLQNIFSQYARPGYFAFFEILDTPTSSGSEMR